MFVLSIGVLSIALTDLNALKCIASTPRVHLKYAFHDVLHVLEVYSSIYLLMNTNLKDKYILQSIYFMKSTTSILLQVYTWGF